VVPVQDAERGATDRNACSRRSDRIDHVCHALRREQLAAVNHRVLLT
jgi:hypothetical protein